MIAYKRENKIKKAELEKVKIGGYASELMDAFLANRVFSNYAKKVVFKECEDAFLRCTDGDSKNCLWQGEFWGKWVISAARACRYAEDSEMKGFLHGATLRLIELQRESGYIGTYKNSEQFTVLEGWSWNWNIWCRKYTLWGLLECYDLCGDEKILTACVRLADNLLFELEKSGKRLAETGTFSGVASCSILKPMLILYRITEDRRYLDFCLDFVKDWENAELMPGLIANSLSGKKMSDWYDFDKIRWAKAYEMMSCFDGLLELYRVTGEDKYLEASECFYDILVKYEQNPLYSVAFNDEFRDAASNINAITEPCDVIHFMRFCHELFTLTGKAKYMDSFELAFYNPFLASSFKNGAWGSRGSRSLGRHMIVYGQANMVHNHCCVNNMPRGYMNMVESQFMSSDDALYINLYTEAEARIYVGGKDVRVSVSGDYLADSSAKIHLDFDGAPTAVKLRVPEWSKCSEIVCDGEKYAAQSGYFELTPTNSKCEIEVFFDNSVKITYIPATTEEKDDPWKIERWVSPYIQGSLCTAEMFLREGRCVLRKGAVLLCRSIVAGNNKAEMFESDNFIDENYTCELTRIDSDAGVNIQFEATFRKEENVITSKLCDYASGSNMPFGNMYAFSIYF